VAGEITDTDPVHGNDSLLVRYAYWRPWVISVLIVVVAVMLLRIQGRVWWCACNKPTLWSSDVWGPHNSQHLLDPYSFTHVLHGFLICGLLTWTIPHLAYAWRFCLANLLQCAWEVLENSPTVIEHFRAATAAQGYTGDSVANSLGDMMACAAGFWLASRLGFWRTAFLTILTEMLLVIWIRDCLALNILMLIWPIEAIKSWQMA
jgi:hypothetical protein